MLFRAHVVTHFAIVALGSVISGRGAEFSPRAPNVTSMLATFEGIPANALPALGRTTPPTPYQGLNYDNAFVIKNQPQGQFVTSLQTTQGSQFIVSEFSPITLSVPDAGETFDLKSAYVGILISTMNSVAIPAEDGLLAFTGTRPNGTTVVETVNYKALGPGIIKVAGVVLVGKALPQKVTFNHLNGLTTLEVTVQSGVATDLVISLLASVGIQVSSIVTSVFLDSLEYDVVSYD